LNNIARRRYHITMAHASIHEQMQPVKRELHNFVDWSSKLPMEDEEDFAGYFERFRSLGDRLLFFRAMSKWECNKLFWQGLHPKDRAALYPYLLDKRPNLQPGANLGFRDLFDLAYPFLARRRLAAETEAETRAKAEAEAEDARQRAAIQQVVQLMKPTGNEISTHDEAYYTLYR
jgi:hypothetical protein